MSNSTLSSFDPFAAHPFTSGASAHGQSHYPPSIRMPKPSPTVVPVQGQQSPQVGPVNDRQALSTSSLPSSKAPTPLHGVQSPQPRLASRSPPQSTLSAQPIFTPFKQERSSPELNDVLAKKKKSVALWPAKPHYVTKEASGEQT